MPDNYHKIQQINMLYVEDHQESRELLLATIQIRFPELCISTAENGQEGLKSFRQDRPDIVMTDINMPVMSGIDMALEIKQEAPETIIIAVTAHSETECLLKAIDIGINHFALKPLDHFKLFTVIEKSVAQSRQTHKLRQQAQHIGKLSQALEQSPSSVVITDRNGVIEYVNPRFSELTGYTLEEALGKNVQILKSGLMDPAVYKQLWQTISSGLEWRGEFLNQKKNGETYWESASIAPLLDASGQASHFIAVKEDITANKLAQQEISKLNASLAQRATELECANRDLEAFNYTVSHDLRSPVTVIHGFAQLLVDKCCPSLDQGCREYSEIILQETKKMDALIKALLRFSRLSSLKIKYSEINLSEMAFEISLDHRMRDPKRQLQYNIANGLRCKGDYELIRIVLENLMSNAWKYTAPIELPTIEFGADHINGQPIYFVRDNGVGFDNSKANMLFSTFTRLHNDDEFEGFGIGLATVQRIIDGHGGKVWAEGAINRGATIYFSLPETNASDLVRLPGD